MSNELSTGMNTGLIAGISGGGQLTAEDAYFKELAAGGSFLPRLQLYTNASGKVKASEFEANHWALVTGKEDLQDLGKNVEVVPLAFRAKALSTQGDVAAYYNPATESFQRVKELSSAKDSGCMCGIEFLIWLPNESVFCTWFAYNVSSKREADKVRSFINGSATFTSKFVKNDKDPKKSFQAPVCNKSSTPPANLPTPEQALEEIDKFKNAKDSVIQMASEAEASATDRVQ